MSTTTELDLNKLPEADLTVPADASEEEWLEVRNQGVGASDVSGILEIDDPAENRGIYKDRYQVWKDKTGRGEPLVYDRDSPIHMGNVQERVLRQELSERLGVPIEVPGLYVNRRNPVLRCTVDGLHTDQDTGELVLSEFKSNAGWQGLKLWADPTKPPLHPLVQVTYSMHLLGVKKAIIFATAGGYFQRRDVDYDPQLGQMLEEEVMDFWNDYVVPDRQPDPSALSLELLSKSFAVATPGEKVTVDAKLARELAEENDASFAAEKQGKARRDKFKARVKAIAGPAEEIYGPDGELLFTVANDSTLRKKDLLEAHPEETGKHTPLRPTFDAAGFQEAYPELHRKFRARSVKFKGE